MACGRASAVPASPAARRAASHAEATRIAAAKQRARIHGPRTSHTADTFLQSRGQVLHVHERAARRARQAMASDDAFVGRQRVRMAV
jgi:hypothetical protein